ncbi:MAG: hypothetical protein ABIV06_02270 [Thermoanaerobaculia bacterium]
MVQFDLQRASQPNPSCATSLSGFAAGKSWVAVAALILLGALPAEAVKRRAFVTSVSGNANLGSWPDAGNATGLAAGNAICRARATAAALPNANTYRVWLSSESTDAYCHLRGQTGEKGTCVGGTPLATGPWYLVNGVTNFTGTLDELTSSNPKIFRPALLDEFGDGLPDEIEGRTYWTGTGADGKQFNNGPFHCSGWTSGVDGSSAARGDGLGTVSTWTQGGFLPSCSTLQRLLCFEPGDSETVTLRWSAGSPAFITSLSGSGNLATWSGAAGESGLDAGDAICRSAAAAAHLPDPPSFVAWLSTTSTDARDRLATNGPWKRLDAYTVAGDLADLTDGSLDTSLHVDENGHYVIGTPEVATGTLADGTASGVNCLEWTNGTSANHTGGRPNYAQLPEWTEFSSSTGCSGSRRLYCFSNRTVLFWDGFDYEGDTSRWSQTAP